MSRVRASHTSVARNSRRFLPIGAASILALLAYGTPASAAVVRDLPGISGRSVQVVAAAPSPTGEVTLVANVRGSGATSQRIRLVRLRADGAPQIGFGRWGVTSAGGRARAVAAAANPSTGRVYVAAIDAGRPVVLAFGSDGRLDRTFGSGGRVRIPGRVAPDSFRVAAVRSYLFVTSGAGRCAGCTVRQLSLPSGQLATRSSLARERLAGRASCTRAGIDAAGMLAGRLVLAADACGRMLLDLPQSHRASGKTLRGSRLPLAPGSRQALLGVDPGQRRACLAARAGRSLRLAGARYAGLAALARSRRSVRSASGVRDVAAFGTDGCAALATGSGAARVYVAAGSERPRLRRVPGLSRADVLAACGKSLLAVGVRRDGGRQRARLVVVAGS